MAVDVVVEEVADNLEELAQATRRINTNSVSFFLGGAAVGAAVGFYFGYRWNKEKIKAEVYAESEKEVSKIREAYQQKVVVATKPSLDEVVEERGYSVGVPSRPLKAPVPAYEPPMMTEIEKLDSTVWNYPEEIQNRNTDSPYVIHQDEYSGNESGYTQTTYTYYAVDNVMVDDAGQDEKSLVNTDYVVGQENLKFGHGTDDADVVFVRNDKLELEMEICRLQKSYEEEVLGLDGNEPETD